MDIGVFIGLFSLMLFAFALVFIYLGERSEKKK